MRRHDAKSVAPAFTGVCQLWGAPEVVCSDNGTEFKNAILDSLFKSMGVRVRTEAVRHPQAQGAAERANRTLIGLIRKVLDGSSDWKCDLRTLLFFYRNRPHSATGVAPMEAMVSWQPSHLIVESVEEYVTASEWVDKLATRSAVIRDIIEEEMSSAHTIDEETECAYAAGDTVMLCHADRHQKRLAPYEHGWIVICRISASTVSIRHSDTEAEKTVNVQLLKPDVLVEDLTLSLTRRKLTAVWVVTIFGKEITCDVLLVMMTKQ